MQKLHFPQPDLRIRGDKDALSVWDIVRKKWVALTPEEWVRQHLVHYLIESRGWSQGLLAVEKPLLVNSRSRRADLVAYNNSMHPVLLAECKAPEIPIDQAVLDQAVLYNRSLRVEYLLITNGLHTSCCRMTGESTEIQWLNDIPFAGR